MYTRLILMAMIISYGWFDITYGLSLATIRARVVLCYILCLFILHRHRFLCACVCVCVYVCAYVRAAARLSCYLALSVNWSSL